MRLISFVIPCYKSERTIKNVTEEIISVISEMHYDYEIILVNDCSPDNLHKVLKELTSRNKRIKVINLTKNFGQHSAIMAGLAFCKGEMVIYLDDDGQCPVDKIGDMISPLDEGWDVAVAKYPEKKQSLFKNAGSYINSRLMAWLTNKPDEIQVSNFWCIKKPIVDEILKYKGPYPSLASLIFRSTLRIACVPMDERERVYGTSTYTIRKLVGLLFSNLLGFTIKPLRVAISLGTLFSILGLIYAFILIIRKTLNPMIAVGYSSLMVAVLFVGGMNLLFLGVIGEYVGRIFMTQNGTPQYCIKETINI